MALFTRRQALFVPVAPAIIGLAQPSFAQLMMTGAGKKANTAAVLWTPGNGTADFITAGATFFAGYRANVIGEITQSGGAVSQWNDWSGNARNVVQATGANKPAYSATSFPGTLPSLTFTTAASSALILASGLGHVANDLLHAFTVSYIGTGIASYRRLVSMAASGAADSGVDGWIPLINRTGSVIEAFHSADLSQGTLSGNPVAFMASSTITSILHSMFINGTAATPVSFTFTTSAMDTLGIGAIPPTPSASWEGQIAEVVIVSGTMTTTLRQLNEGYLAWKWGLQGDLPGGHPYAGAPPTI